MSKQEDIKPIEIDDGEELQTARQEIFSYYRHLRSNLFSDTIIEYETKLTKEVFDLKLLQLSQDKKAVGVRELYIGNSITSYNTKYQATDWTRWWW